MGSVGDVLGARGASSGSRAMAGDGANEEMGEKSKESFGAPASSALKKKKLATSWLSEALRLLSGVLAVLRDLD